MVRRVPTSLKLKKMKEYLLIILSDHLDIMAMMVIYIREQVEARPLVLLLLLAMYVHILFRYFQSSSH